MKYLIPIIIIAGLALLAGCQVQTETKYQCENGEVVDSIDLCSSQTCPELNCSECLNQTQKDELETISGSIEVNIYENDNKDLNDEGVEYKFSDYSDYQDFVKDEVEDLVGMEELGNYGGQEAKYNGSVYFLYYKKGEWDFYNYWAVEVDAESGELIKYKDITASDGSRDRFDEIWWTPK